MNIVAVSGKSCATPSAVSPVGNSYSCSFSVYIPCGIIGDIPFFFTGGNYHSACSFLHVTCDKNVIGNDVHTFKITFESKL